MDARASRVTHQPVRVENLPRLPPTGSAAQALLYKVKLNDFETLGLLDSGADLTVINRVAWKRIDTPLNRTSKFKVKSASNHEMSVLGTTRCNVGCGRFQTSLEVKVVDDKDLSTACFLGRDFWQALLVYREVMQAINAELEPVYDEFPDLRKRAEKMIQEAHSNEDLFLQKSYHRTLPRRVGR